MARQAPAKSITESESFVQNIHQNDVFKKHMGSFIHPRGANLIERTRPFGEWVDERTALNSWPYFRSLLEAPYSTTRIKSQNGRVVKGINFGSQDYLGLSSHPDVHMAVLSALREYGPHTASSPALQGNSKLSLELEQSLAELLDTDHVMLFPTGWGAGFGTIVGLVREEDHVLVDHLSHACLVQGARAATGNLSAFRHNDTESVRRRLRSIRAKDTENGILVVTEGIFSMDSDSPDILTLQGLCREFDAVLLVDVAHDLGSSGPGGTGQIGIQKMLGDVDLVMGSFSKSFATNGGFLATQKREVKQFVGMYGGPHIFSNALSPLGVAVAKASLRIIRSAEGDLLRKQSSENISRLRSGFAQRGIECMGQPSNIVPVNVGDEILAKRTSGILEKNGLMTNLVEFPAVPKGQARFRFQVMATHTLEQVDEAVEIFSHSVDLARQMMCEDSVLRASVKRGQLA